MASTSEAHLTCLCGTVSVPGSLLSASELPLQVKICHCNFCRYATGSLGLPWPTLKSSPPEKIIAKMTGYKVSEKTMLYFCDKCGCHCFISTYQKNWFCTSGIIEQSPSSKRNGVKWPENVFKVSYHGFVADTIDGGMTPFLLSLNGRSIPTWSERPDSSSADAKHDFSHVKVLSLPAKSSTASSAPGGGAYLPAKCHCGGISLLIKRGNYSSDSPIQFSARSLPRDTTKHLAYMCACRSCRLSTGVSLTAWTLVPPSSVFNGNFPIPLMDTSSLSNTTSPDLEPVVFGYATSNADLNPGLTLKHNWSSPDTCRSFCGTCGATVSYWCAKRPLEVDLAVGLFRAEEGSMARRWLDWSWGMCSFEEECVDREMLQAWKGCAEVMEVWRE